MATINHTSLLKGSGALLYTWEGMGDDDEGAWLEVPGAADKTVQFGGTWGGATIVWQGSMDKVTNFTLTDADGNAISVTADAMRLVRENTRYVRPVSSGGTGTDVDVRLLAKRTM